MYVVTGATGNTGRRIVELLDPAKNRVRIIGRSAERLQPLVDQGAEAFVGSVEDSGAMTTVFTGAEVVFAMIPPNLAEEDFRAYQNRVANAYAEAIEKAGVRYVVTLSSVGAHLENGVGVVNGLYDFEQRLNKIEGDNVLHLRPTFFMENLLWQVDTITNVGFMGSAQRADLSVPMIATEDIARYAAERMQKRDFSGKSPQELLGPREYTMNEVATILGSAIGKPELKFVQFSYEDTAAALKRMGVSDSVVAGYIELYKAFNEGLAKPTEARSEMNTTPMTLEEFARTFAAVYEAGVQEPTV